MRESIAEIFCVFVMMVISFLIYYYGRGCGSRTHTHGAYDPKSYASSSSATPRGCRHSVHDALTCRQDSTGGGVFSMLTIVGLPTYPHPW